MKETIKKVKLEVEETDLGFGKRIFIYAVRNKEGYPCQYFLKKADAIEYKDKDDSITKEILWTK